MDNKVIRGVDSDYSSVREDRDDNQAPTSRIINGESRIGIPANSEHPGRSMWDEDVTYNKRWESDWYTDKVRAPRTFSTLTEFFSYLSEDKEMQNSESAFNADGHQQEKYNSSGLEFTAYGAGGVLVTPASVISDRMSLNPGTTINLVPDAKVQVNVGGQVKTFHFNSDLMSAYFHDHPMFVGKRLERLVRSLF